MRVLRLNVQTFPVTRREGEILDAAGIERLEIEGESPDEIVGAADEADALMVCGAPLPGAVVGALPRCRLISRIGTGVDKIDIAEATRRGILVTNVPDALTEAVADHTMALLLNEARRLPLFSTAMRQGRHPRGVPHMHRLSAQTLGLVGFGRIGKAVTRRAAAFGMDILACDPAVTDEDAQTVGATRVDLETVLCQADYLCLLCPLNAGTRHMIGMAELRQMKRTAVLVNTGRGELVKEDDLVEALRRGVIRGAALDVYDGIDVLAPRGFATDHPLFSLDNVFMTPHAAAYGEEGMAELVETAALAVVDVLQGRWPLYPINPEAVPRVALASRA